ncbi:MAG: hypothetical protein ABI972_18020 [Acidobacteriota bacterium]
MFQAKRQAAFSTWQAPGHELEVVYSQVVMHEVVLRALDGLHSMPGVGLEVGGILFGTADENEVRITASRELTCAHSKGQAFLLNEADESRLERLLTYYKEETDLAGLAPVGFYVSRTRNELALSDADLHLLEKYFPEAQQVVLVVRVARGRSTRAGFFVREADGSVQRELTHKEFEAAPASEAGLRPMSRSERESTLRAAAVVPIRPPEEAEPAAETEAVGWTAPEELMDRPKRHPWPWKTMIAAVACFVALASVIVYMRGSRASGNVRESVGLRLIERSGFLLAEWDGNAKLIQGQTAGALEVDDGEPRRYVMNETLLRGGQWRVITTSENVVVKLRVGAQGDHVETARYVDPGASARVARPQLEDAGARALQARLEVKQQRLQEMIQANNLLDAQREGMLAAVRERLAAASGATASKAPRPQVQLPPRPEAGASQTVALALPPPVAPAGQTAVGALPLGLQSQGVRPPSAPPVEQLDRNGPQFAERVTPPKPAATPVPAPTPPAYQGPRVGRVIWTGNLTPGGTLVITGRQASSGTLTGALPQVPVRIGAYVAELGGQGFTAYSGNAKHARGNVVEAPGAQNGWQKTAYRYDPKRAGELVVAEAPSADNGWQKMLFRASARPVTAILIEWELAQ